MLRNCIKILLCLFLTTANITRSWSQEKPVISYFEMWQDIVSSTDTIYLLKNSSVEVDSSSRMRVLSLLSKNPIIKPQITLKNVSFTFLDDAASVHHQDQVDWTFNKIEEVLRLIGLTFQRQLNIENNGSIEDINFRNCTFENGLRLSEIRNVEIGSHSVISQGLYISGDKQLLNQSHLTLSDSKIEMPISKSGKDPNMTKLQTWLWFRDFGTVRVKNLQVTADPDQENGLDFHNINRLVIESSNIDVTASFDNVRLELFNIYNSTFKNLRFNNVAFPNQYDFHCRWNQFNALILMERSMTLESGMLYEAYIKYFAKSDSELNMENKYDRLIAYYYKFLQLYKLNGDQESAKACHEAMKDIETSRLNYLNRQNPNHKN